MKKLIFLLPLFSIVACNDSKKVAEETKQAVLDSVNTANYASQVRQRTIDSMNASNVSSMSSRLNRSENSTVQNTEINSSTPANRKKRMSNTTKGALIGAGAGIVTGAVTGAVVSKDKTKGAVVGGIIGGAIGSGVGYGAGSKIDKKE